MRVHAAAGGEGPEKYGFGTEVMKEIRVCGHCGTMARADSYVCPHCGERLPRETLYQRYQRRHQCCPVCDTVVSSRMRFCPHCGTCLGSMPPNLNAKRDERSASEGFGR